MKSDIFALAAGLAMTTTAQAGVGVCVSQPLDALVKDMGSRGEKVVIRGKLKWNDDETKPFVILQDTKADDWFALYGLDEKTSCFIATGAHLEIDAPTADGI